MLLVDVSIFDLESLKRPGIPENPLRQFVYQIFGDPILVVILFGDPILVNCKMRSKIDVTSVGGVLTEMLRHYPFIWLIFQKEISATFRYFSVVYVNPVWKIVDFYKEIESV